MSVVEKPIDETIPTEAEIALWWETQQQLEKLKSLESTLRMKIYKHWFKDPKEGTNDHPLGEGFVAKGVRKINRNVDEAALKVFTAAPTEGAVSMLGMHQIAVDKVIKYKPELVISEYRKLTDEQRLIFDQVLVIKEGMPGLEIAKPSSRNQAK